jgi:hypothetical protein
MLRLGISLNLATILTPFLQKHLQAQNKVGKASTKNVRIKANPEQLCLLQHTSDSQIKWICCISPRQTACFANTNAIMS